MATLCDLMQAFQAKIDVVKDSLLLKQCLDDPEKKEMLSPLRSSLQEVQLTLTVLRTEVKRQKESLDKLKDLNAKFEMFTERVNHMQNNIPEHLPNKVHQEQPSTTASIKTPQPAHKKGSTTNQVHSSKVKGHVPSIRYLTAEEFNAAPKYMKGRMTYETINRAVAEINKALAYKHSILTMPQRRQSIQVKNQLVAYKEQESKATDGYFFIVNEDILTNSNLKLDNTGRNCLTILRHCGRLKEVRHKQVVHYCVLPDVI